MLYNTFVLWFIVNQSCIRNRVCNKYLVIQICAASSDFTWNVRDVRVCTPFIVFALACIIFVISFIDFLIAKPWQKLSALTGFSTLFIIAVWYKKTDFWGEKNYRTKHDIQPTSGRETYGTYRTGRGIFWRYYLSRSHWISKYF